MNQTIYLVNYYVNKGCLFLCCGFCFVLFVCLFFVCLGGVLFFFVFFVLFFTKLKKHTHVKKKKKNCTEVLYIKLILKPFPLDMSLVWPAI